MATNDVTKVNETKDQLYVLDEAGLAELTKEIFKGVNERIDERIALRLCPHSDDDHVPSAKTVYEAIDGLTQIKYLTITSGDITEANITPDSTTIYMVRKSATDVKATMYIWLEDVGFIDCGGTTIGELDGVTINAIPNNVIGQIVAESYSDTDPNLDNTNTGREHLDDEDDE